MMCELSKFCFYRNERIATNILNSRTYISTENMLPNKGGVTSATSLPTVPQTSKFRCGDTLVSNIRPYFKKIWFAEYDGGCSNDVLVFSAKEGVVPKFLYYVLANDSFFAYSTATSKGTKMPRGDKDSIMQYQIEKVDYPSQKKIAAILSALDEKIELNKRINDNLYQLLMLSFKNEYWNVKQNHPEWKLTTLDEATSRFGTGLNPRKNFVLGHGNNYYVTIKNMGNNRIYLDDRCDKVDDDAIQKIQKRSDLQVGDLLFSGIGTIGRVYLIDKPVINWNTSESVFNLRPNNTVSSEFLYLLLLNNDMQEYAISLASGSVQKGIRMADLKRYSFPLPTANVMLQLTLIWKPIIQKIKANEEENDTVAMLRDSLLSKLMTGEVDVSNIQF